MRVNVFFDEKLWDADILDADVIEIPDAIVPELAELRDNFLKWLNDKDNNHEYWFFRGGEKYGVSYGSEAFIKWLNDYPLKECLGKASMIERCAKKVDKRLPYIDF